MAKKIKYYPGDGPPPPSTYNPDRRGAPSPQEMREQAAADAIRMKSQDDFNKKLNELEQQRLESKIEEDWQKHDIMIVKIISLKKQNGMFQNPTINQQKQWNVDLNGEPLKSRMSNNFFQLSKSTKAEYEQAIKIFTNPFIMSPIILIFVSIIYFIKKRK